MFDLTSILLMGLLAFLGWRKGLVLMAISLAGLILGYGAAYAFYLPLGQTLARLFSWQPLVSWAAAGFLLFFSVQLLAGVVGWRWQRRRRTAAIPRSLLLLDRAAGALFGAGYGLALLVLLTWALGLLPLLTDEVIIETRDSYAHRLLRPATEQLTRTLASEASGSEELARAAVQVARDPQRSMEQAKKILEERRVQQLFGDPRFIQALATGQDKVYDRNTTFRTLSQDEAFIRKLEEAHLLSEPITPLNPLQRRRAMAQHLAPLARVIVGMGRDPEVRRILENPQLLEKLQERDLWALANDAQFNQLVTRMLELLQQAPGSATAGAKNRPAGQESRDTSPSVPSTAKQSGAGESSTPAMEKHPAPRGYIYRWKDGQGVLHFSDQPPPAGVRYEIVKPQR